MHMTLANWSDRESGGPRRSKIAFDTLHMNPYHFFWGEVDLEEVARWRARLCVLLFRFGPHPAPACMFLPASTIFGSRKPRKREPSSRGPRLLLRARAWIQGSDVPNKMPDLLV